MPKSSEIFRKKHGRIPNHRVVSKWVEVQNGQFDNEWDQTRMVQINLKPIHRECYKGLAILHGNIKEASFSQGVPKRYTTSNARHWTSSIGKTHKIYTQKLYETAMDNLQNCMRGRSLQTCPRVHDGRIDYKYTRLKMALHQPVWNL